MRCECGTDVSTQMVALGPTDYERQCLPQPTYGPLEEFMPDGYERIQWGKCEKCGKVTESAPF